MGDFSLSCALTGLTIHGADAVLIPLGPANFADNGREHPGPAGGVGVCSNEGAAACFGPLTLPIFGHVGCYGDFEGVEKDDHTAFLEKKLGIPIEEFCSAVFRGEKVAKITAIADKRNRDEWFKKYNGKYAWSGTLSGCVILRSAWDHFTTSALDESGGETISVYDESWVEPGLLKRLGFKKGKRDEAEAARVLNGSHDPKRYSTPHTHPLFPGLRIWSDENMSVRVERDGKMLLHRRPSYGKMYDSEPHYIKHVIETLAQHGMVLPEEKVAKLKGITRHWQPLVNAKKEYFKQLRDYKKREQREADYPEFSFKLVSDTTPAEETARQKKEQAEHMAELLNTLKAGWGEKVEEPAEKPEPVSKEPLPCPLGITQVLTDGKIRVTVYASKPGEAETYSVDDWPQEDAGHHLGEYMGIPIPAPFVEIKWQRHLAWPQALRDEVKARGWKHKPEKRHIYITKDYYFRSFPDEMRTLYGAAIYRLDHLRRMERLLVLMGNMHAANKLLQPTDHGWQYGNNYAQRAVAEFAMKEAQRRIDRSIESNKEMEERIAAMPDDEKEGEEV